MISTKVHGEVKDGKLIADRPDFLKQSFACREGKRCTVTVADYKTTRSLRQNAYYWAVVIKTIMDEGFGAETDEKTHLALCAMYAPLKVIDCGNVKDVVVQGRTSDMSTKEMEDYLELVRVGMLSEYGIRIALPNEAEY
jgi:hypothetical protein